MAVQVPCPHCREPAELAEEELGRPRRCPRCGRDFVPELSSVAAASPPAPGPDPGWSPSRPSELAIGSTFAGRYQVLRKLGDGGQGAVYLAHDTNIDRDVALKIPRFDPADGPSALDRFHREARAAGRLHHPNICPVYDVRIDGVPYLTMAYIEGEPLSPRAGAVLIPQRRAAVIVYTLARTLAKAHAKGVVHRDLKPSNIMIQPQGEPVIMDFGLARRTGTDDPRLTKTGTVLGSPAYMSPEQALGDARDAGPASDIFSLGVILYELLTGRLPFEGPVLAILYKIVNVDPQRPSALREGLDPRLEAICLKAMAKRVEDRHASMTELAEALRVVLARTSRPAQPTSQAGAPPARPAPVPRPAAAPSASMTNSIGMTLVSIPAGEFLMGSPDSDKDASAVEKPQHRVAISRPFYLSSCPVTQEEYQKVMGKNPSYFKGSNRLPVDQVSWFDAVEFCNRLGAAEKLKPFYKVAGQEVTILGGDGYRLPTEAEWEYACRAGSTTRYGFGDDSTQLGDYAWYADNSRVKETLQTHPVGQKKPNAWDLYDMHGNVWEWCWDWFDSNVYKQMLNKDPTGPNSGTRRVLRGGSYDGSAADLRSAYRLRDLPAVRGRNYGFRPARTYL